MLIHWLLACSKKEMMQEERHCTFSVGTYAPAKLHRSAVKRNRMRRRCREALRLALRDMEGDISVQLLLCPRSASLQVKFAEICTDVSQFFLQLSSCHQKKNSGPNS